MNHIEYQNSRLYYSKAGNGDTPLLVFHGFGQSHRVFEEWGPAVGKHYTLYAFDLYFHGESVWPSRKPLEKSDWHTIINLFLEQAQIEKFAIAGYSLGGKFALATLEAFSERTLKVFLLAPDGIRINPWYTIATYPYPTRNLFKSMVLHPGRFYVVAKILLTFGLINRGILRFAESQMDTEEKRRRVYFSWVYFRHLKFSMNKIAKLINRNQIPVTLITGKYDKVIPTKNMNPLLKRLDQKHLEVMDYGHNDLVGKAVEFLK